MAPQFALFLSPEGIALAHRQTAGHWAVLGDTPLDVPDLGAALVVLRKLAQSRVEGELQTLVILPDDQVLYTSLTAPGPDEADRVEQIRSGLEGLTPYNVEDLAFDYVPLEPIEDGRVKLAVVADETLDEARAFATEHGFTPVGLAARPLDDRYPRIAHFDRSLPWVDDIADIDFGRDTWQPPKPETDNKAPDEPDEEEAAPETNSPETEDAGSPEGATTEPAPLPEKEGRAEEGSGGPDESASETVSAEQSPPSEDPSRTDAEPEPSTGGTGVTAEQDDTGSAEPEQPAPAAKLTLPDSTGLTRPEAPKKGSEALAESDTSATDNAASEDEPLQIPAGFGAGRSAKSEPGALVSRRKSRFGPAADGDSPTLPRVARDETAETSQPTFGRGTSKSTDDDAKPPRPKRSRKGGKSDSPDRPPQAGPEPKMPPLARIKSEIESRKATTTEPLPLPARKPFEKPSAATSGAARFKDRVAGLGRQISASSDKARDKARDAATDAKDKISKSGGLKDRLKGLNPGRKAKADASDLPATAPAPEAEIAPPPPTEKPSKPAREKARRGGLGLRGRKGAPKAPLDAAARSALAEVITPPSPAPTPAATAERPKFDSGRARRGQQDISEADAPILGGLLARGSIASQRGPSLRGGLILTLILLAVLAILGFWAVFYLPETALGRWMGLSPDEDPVIIAETAPESLAAPGTGATTPSSDPETPLEISSVGPDAVLPGPITTAPQAPDLLPDIDAPLDLEPEPVVPPVDPEALLPSEEENANFYARTGVWQRPPVLTIPTPDTDIEDDVVFAGLDPHVNSHDAIALASSGPLPSDMHPASLSAPIAPEMQVSRNIEDLVDPSPEGTLAPYGVRIYSGPPAVLSQPRPTDSPAALAAAEAEVAAQAEADAVAAAQAEDAITAGAIDAALLRAARPEARPDDLMEQQERYVLGGITYQELAAIRPETRPQSVQELADQAASADGVDTTPGDVTNASTLAVAVSYVPVARPANIDALVQEARAAGATAPDAGHSGSDTIQLDIPSSASVTRAATEENAINLRNVNLIGVTGASGARRALIRLPTGRFVTVEVGDRLDGGQVAAIGETSLQYVKRGRTITLEVPG